MGLDDLIKGMPSVSKITKKNVKSNFTPTYFEFPSNIKLDKYWLEKIPDNCERILDLGCGLGYTTRWIYDNKCKQVVGVDASKDAIKQAISLQPIKHFYVNDFKKLNFRDNNFDIVWAQDSLKYANNINEFMSNIAYVLKSLGRLFAIIPLYGLSSKELIYAWMPSNIEEVKELCINAGFEIEKIEQIDVLSKFGVLHQASNNQFIFLIAKKE